MSIPSKKQADNPKTKEINFANFSGKYVFSDLITVVGLIILRSNFQRSMLLSKSKFKKVIISSRPTTNTTKIGSHN